jgi:hypothetical protein
MVNRLLSQIVPVTPDVVPTVIMALDAKALLTVAKIKFQFQQN